MKLLFIFGASILLAIVTITSSAPRLVNFSKMTVHSQHTNDRKKNLLSQQRLELLLPFHEGGGQGYLFQQTNHCFFYFLYFDNILFLFYQNEKCGLLNSDSKASPQLNCRALKSTKN